MSHRSMVFLFCSGELIDSCSQEEILASIVYISRFVTLFFVLSFVALSGALNSAFKAELNPLSTIVCPKWN